MTTDDLSQTEKAILRVDNAFRYAAVVKTHHWQGIDVSKKPEMEMRELADYLFSIRLTTEHLPIYQKQLLPALPWADNHFEQDRVSGQPLNPGRTWQDWPYSNSADNFRDDIGQFSHSYAERYWPKFAGLTPTGELPEQYMPHQGIRFPYGDLSDVVTLLVKDPHTRQAVLPVFFPEDTGAVKGQRVPCTVSYTFAMRADRLNVFYHIRSCDFVRHFRDDVYLTIRLLLWVLDECRKQDRMWERVHPGNLNMYINSLHMFVNDWNQRYHRE